MKLFESKNPFDTYKLDLLEEDDEQVRVSNGIKAQRMVANYIRQKVPGARVLRIAKPSSKKTDIVVAIGAERINIECKSFTDFITAYDKNISRGQADEVLDRAVSTLPDNKTQRLAFTQLMDVWRRKDSTIGFSGDPGVADTGRIPPVRIQGSRALHQLRSALKARYISKGENYLALVNLATGEINFHYLAGPLVARLHPTELPAIAVAKLNTYGNPYTKGAVRAAIKIRFASL